MRKKVIEFSLSWPSEKKKEAKEYAHQKNMSLNELIRESLWQCRKMSKEKRGKINSKVKIKCSPEFKKELNEGLDPSVLTFLIVDHYMRSNPLELTTLKPPPTDEMFPKLHLIKDLVEYDIPNSNIRIAVRPDDENGWRGFVYKTDMMGSASTWSSRNLEIPLWAKTPSTERAMRLLASRWDQDGKNYFVIPNTDPPLAIEREWFYEDGIHRCRGFVTNTKTNHSEQWHGSIHGVVGFYGYGEYNGRRNISWALTVITSERPFGKSLPWPEHKPPKHRRDPLSPPPHSRDLTPTHPSPTHPDPTPPPPTSSKP